MPINVNGKLRVKGVGQIGPILTEFISVWDTTLGDGNPSITLPLVASGNYNFSVNWGDGNTDTITSWNQAEVTHTYATGGIKTITITGTIEGWQFIYGGDCEKLTSITNIGPLKLGNDGAYFYGCSNLTTIGGTFDLTGVTNLINMFAGCTSLTSVNGIETWDTSNVTAMSYMFGGGNQYFNQDISSWDTSAVTDMGGMFQSATSFNQDISSWDVSSVIDMTGMFGNATAFNQDISGWDTSNVQYMSSMFQNVTSFNQDISSWDVSSVTNMSGMFEGATLFNQDISSWDTSNVQFINGMFYNATSFNQPLNSWDISAAIGLNYMFYGATAFNQPLTSWNVSAVTNMNYMFYNATAFNQDISGWDVSNVQLMNYMFTNATAFNQDISGWDVSNVTGMKDFMTGKSTANYSYYDDLLNAWSLLTLQNGVLWDMGSIEYDGGGDAGEARQNIIDTYGWTITDGGEIPK